MSDYRNKPKKPNKPTMSHIMVFIILMIYVLVALVGIVVLIISRDSNERTQVMIGLFGYTGACGATTITVYTIKATKENQIKISNDIYRMKLELAKEIYKEVSNKQLDDKSIALLNLLNEDKSDDTLASAITIPTPQVQITSSSSDDALGRG